MSPKILRRCDVCGRFHVAYLVPAEEGQPRYYCYDCWKASAETSGSQPSGKDISLPRSAKKEKPT